MNLNDLTLLETRAYVNGEWLNTGKTFPVHNPLTGELIADVTDLSVEETNAAINAA
ncbi:MAG: hypothetical protein V3U65_06925 [Granulosicoccaceae bacterium]